MKPTEVPNITVQRLPLYLRALTFLRMEGRQITSSQELGDKLSISSAQIRKDLSYFGEFGKQGTGYEIEYLEKKLREILNLEREWEMLLVGAGDLGRAIAHYDGFRPRGFHVTAVFDNNPKKIGAYLGHLEILDSKLLPQVIKEQDLKIAIVAVPATSAQKVVDTLVEAGIKAILNYAPITLNVPQDVRIYYIDPLVGLQSMAYYLDE